MTGKTDQSLPASRARVLIVDDHELIRSGLRQLINSQPGLRVCGEAENASDGLSRVQELRPDLLIVDLSLQSGNGLDLVREVVTLHPAINVLVLTVHDERDYGERVLQAGAVGYVNKQEPADTVLTAIQEVLAGRMYFSQALTDRVMQRAMRNASAPTESAVVDLSNRELEVFNLLGQGLTTEEIANRLFLSPNTVGTYRERIKIKLHLPNSAALSHFATLWVAENH